MRKSFTFLASILTVLLCLSFAAFAQRTSGDIQGTVTDPNGAVVPGASVTVTGKDVGFNRTVTTDSAGLYRVQQVPPGNYTVSVAAISGFSAQTKENVQVSINNTTTLDFAMAVGATGAVVDVTGEGAPDNAAPGGVAMAITLAVSFEAPAPTPSEVPDTSARPTPSHPAAITPWLAVLFFLAAVALAAARAGARPATGR